jgi:drug/metabolite transporter (DMT)-like permease
LISIIFGIIAAITWGGSDFAGGLSSRKLGAIASVFLCESIGLVILIIALPFSHETFPLPNNAIISFISGAIGTSGLLMLYKSIQTGKMSIATPVSGVVAAILPVIVGFIRDGSPGPVKIFGFIFALSAVWLISANNTEKLSFFKQLSDLKLPILSGFCFGLYFILINLASHQSTVWPMVISRSGGTLLMLSFVLLKRVKIRPVKGTYGIVLLNSVLDITGNCSFIIAGQYGRMDIASILGSLYPGGTVLLAWIFLKEKINRTQGFGIVAALSAIGMLST